MIPVVGLVAAQAAGVIFLDGRLALLLGAVTWLLAATLLLLAARGFRRERLLLQV